MLRRKRGRPIQAVPRGKGAMKELDNRGLEPPMPMVHTLDAYGELPPGGTLRIHNDLVPIYLLPQLEARGASYEIDERPDGSAYVTIHKPDDTEGPAKAP